MSSKNVRGRRNTRRGRGNNRPVNQNFLKLTMPKSIISNSFRTRLAYLDTSNGSLVSATSYTSVRYRPTSAFDVDPAIGGTTMPGFAEYSAFYNMYRVLGATMRVEFINQLAFPVDVYVWPSNQDLGAGYSQVGPAQLNPYSRTTSVTPAGTGNSQKVLSLNMPNLRNYVGSSAELYDSTYSSLVSTSPTDNIYFNVGAWSQVAANVLAAPGIFTHTIIGIDVVFYDRKELVT